MVGPDGGVAEALRAGVGLDAGLFVQLLGLSHEGDGLQYVEAADGTAGQMHLGPALPGRLLDLLVEGEVGERADGQHHEAHAPAQHRHRHGSHRLHRGRLHDVLRLQRQQGVHVRAGRTAHGGRRLLCRGEGAAGDAHQLVVLQQALLPRVGHNVSEEAAAHDAKFRFHDTILLFPAQSAGFSFPSIPCLPRKSKSLSVSVLALSVTFGDSSPKGRALDKEGRFCGMQKPLPLGEPKSVRTSPFTQETGRFAQVFLIFFRRCGTFRAVKCSLFLPFLFIIQRRFLYAVIS